VLDAAPESSTEAVIEQTPPAKAPKQRAKKADKVEVKVEEVQPEPIIVTEPVAEPVTEPVTEVKPKARSTSRPTQKTVEIEQNNVTPAEPPTPAEQPPFNPPIQIIPDISSRNEPPPVLTRPQKKNTTLQ